MDTLHTQNLLRFEFRRYPIGRVKAFALVAPWPTPPLLSFMFSVGGLTDWSVRKEGILMREGCF